MPTITVDVDIDLSDFSSRDLREELEARGELDDDTIPEELWEWLRLHGVEVPLAVRDWAYAVKGVIV